MINKKEVDKYKDIFDFNEAKLDSLKLKRIQEFSKYEYAIYNWGKYSNKITRSEFIIYIIFSLLILYAFNKIF